MITQPTEDKQTFAARTDIKALVRWWPPSHRVPQLLLDIASLTASLRRDPLMTTGFWGIAGGHVSDWYIVNGTDLLDQFGLFLTSYDGDYAIWYHDGAVPGAEPVVLLDDTGAVRVLAPNICAFFEAFASGRGIGGLKAFEDASLCGDITAVQITQRYTDGAKILAAVSAASKPPPSVPAPDLRTFFQVFSADQEQKNRTDATLQAIVRLLQAHVPQSADQDSVAFRAVVAGKTIVVTTWLVEPDLTNWAPLPEREQLIPLLLQARRERAQGPTAAFGPWSEAWLRLYHSGYTTLNGIWDIRDPT
jgi:hypothetical protein